MTFEEAATKFRGCAEYAEWPKAKPDALIGFAHAAVPEAGRRHVGRPRTF